jgi:hypothetical protein
MDRIQKKQARLRQLSKFNHTTLLTLPNIFLCGKCRKYNNVTKPGVIQNCSFCNNPNYISN